MEFVANRWPKIQSWPASAAWYSIGWRTILYHGASPHEDKYMPIPVRRGSGCGAAINQADSEAYAVLGGLLGCSVRRHRAMFKASMSFKDKMTCWVSMQKRDEKHNVPKIRGPSAGRCNAFRSHSCLASPEPKILYICTWLGALPRDVGKIKRTTPGTSEDRNT